MYLYTKLASFPGSPLAPTKNKNGGGEPGTDSHVISRHVDVTATLVLVEFTGSISDLYYLQLTNQFALFHLAIV